MTLSTTTLLWIAVIVLAALVAYLLWRLMSQPSAAVAPQPDPHVNERAPRADEAPQRLPPQPTAAPPPAMAGPRHNQPAGGRMTSPTSPTGARPSSGATPPPAAAGPRPAHAPLPMPDIAPRRTAAPPPAAAGSAATGARPGASAAPSERHTPAPPASPNPDRSPGRSAPAAANALLAATSWGYQLQRLNIERAAGSPFDVLVIDYSKDGSDEKALREKELDRLRRKPDGGRRLLLSYLSVGEAESYRYYWNPAWNRNKPSWLLSENPEWKENFAVCYWDPGWQRLMCGSAESYLDKLIAAGFDGVYLDKCDVFEDLERREKKAARSRPDLEGDMVDFVVHISRYAKSKSPGFLVVMQNAENLLEHEPLRAALDGVAKEELLFGVSGVQRKNSRDDVESSRRALDLAKRAGKAVMVVEYLEDNAKIQEAARYAESAGYVLYVAPKDRELDRLNYVVLEA